MGKMPRRYLYVCLALLAAAVGSAVPTRTLTARLAGVLEASERPRRSPGQGPWDVIVVGSEPEGTAAAVAAAESGARTLLVTQDARLGGLFVLGGLNSLDVRTVPLVQRGLFERWWERVGRDGAFDTGRAEAAFKAMLRGAGVTVRLEAEKVTPRVQKGRVVGVRVDDQSLHAAQIVDATADGDLAAAAGAAYTFGFSSLGVDARMADTLVFRVDGVDWNALAAGVRAQGAAYAQVGGNAAWGPFGGVPAAYRPVQEGVRLRGLNLGRQDDGSVLVNALLLYGVDPFSPESLASGHRRGRLEAPRIVRYLSTLPGFAGARYGGVAERLYVRESRHFRARCTLTVDDVLGNVVRPTDVAAGSYPLDVQTLTPDDHGYVYGVPEVYGVRLCTALPRRPENLWVVGKTAGYDPLAASSARVVPFGMALGEAVGVAAAAAARTGRTASALTRDSAAVARLRGVLRERGAYLPDVRARAPSGPASHPHFSAYRVLRSKGLALGGYDNDPRLDEPMPALGYLYLLANVGVRFWGDDGLGEALLARFPALEGDLTAETALTLARAAACASGSCRDFAAALPGVDVRAVLSRGQAYELAAALAALEP